MRVLISAIGRLKKGTPEYLLIEDYLKKIGGPVRIVEQEEKKSLSREELKKAEASLLLKPVAAGSKKIVLDEKGKLISSQELASLFQKWQNEGTKDICFLIGGADGHLEETRQQADVVISFGRITLPHMLARVVLVEQLYRVKTILSGHPYHRA